MVEHSDPPAGPPLFRWIVTGLWWMALFALAMMIDIDDDVMFALILLMPLGIAVALFILGMPLWMLISGLIALSRRRWRTALLRLVVPLLGVPFAFAGDLAGHQWLIHMEGDGLAQAVADKRAGRPVLQRFMATQDAAYVETGADFEMALGIAYDTTDTLGEMLALENDQRPREWLDRMPQAFSCYGAARPLGGHYWRTTLDRYNCAR